MEHGPRVWNAMFLFVAVLSVSPAQALDFGRNPSPLFEVGSHRIGESPAHQLSFSVFRGELETYRAEATYPEGFRFNGFDVLGPPGSQVGALTLDFNSDGTADLTVPLLSVTSRSAYADLIPDGRFSPGLEPVLQAGGRTFVLRLPFGGDANADTLVALFDARVTLVLFPGLITNPDRAGTYVITAELVSVDPDTDGADDGVGVAPMALAFELAVTIEDINQAPVADPGPDQVVKLGGVVVLDGRASADPDAGPGPLTFAWSQAAGPGVTLSGTTTATPTFTPPAIGTYAFDLVVGDGLAASVPGRVTIRVPLPGDVDLDGDVDMDDLNIVLGARNTAATGPNDLRDLNADGRIDALDARVLTTLCTRPRCATQ